MSRVHRSDFRQRPSSFPDSNWRVRVFFLSSHYLIGLWPFPDELFLTAPPLRTFSTINWKEVKRVWWGQPLLRNWELFHMPHSATSFHLPLSCRQHKLDNLAHFGDRQSLGQIPKELLETWPSKSRLDLRMICPHDSPELSHRRSVCMFLCHVCA